jgi:hypothetical protein
MTSPARVPSAQWPHDAHHRPSRERLVPHEGRAEALRSQYPAQKAHRGARVPAIEVSVGRPKSVEPDSGDDELLRPRLGDRDAHGA